MRTSTIHTRATRTPTSETVGLPDGRSIHARVWPGRAPTVVLLHGLLDSAEGWDETCRATDRACVAFDLGGFGASSLPAHAAFSAYALDVIAGLDALVPGEMVLIGHSLGGGVATAVAERLPERVRALVLLAPAGFGRIGLAEAVSLPGVRNVAEQLLPVALGNRWTMAAAYSTMVANGVGPSDAILERVLAQRGTVAPGAVLATKAVVRGGLSKRAFHRRGVAYSNPVTVVWGDRDRLVPISHLAGVAAAFPHADARVWKGMGHHPQSERPEDLGELIEATARSVQRRPQRRLTLAPAA